VAGPVPRLGYLASNWEDHATARPPRYIVAGTAWTRRRPSHDALEVDQFYTRVVIDPAFMPIDLTDARLDPAEIARVQLDRVEVDPVVPPLRNR
jgi:hypothetical protein